MSERLFVAIGFDEDLCQRLEREVKKVKINLDKAEILYKWSYCLNYHVTLAFIGETPQDRKDEIIQQLKTVQELAEPFELLISGVDAFKSENEARVIYCGVQNKKVLRELVHTVRENLGYQPDDTFEPHLSIARLRNPANVKDIISPLKRKDFFKIHVNGIRLYKSVLSGNFPSYKVLERFPLKKSLNVAE